MGFYGISRCEMKRTTLGGKRFICVRVYDEVASKWYEHNIEGWPEDGFQQAFNWALPQLMAVDM